MNGEKIIKIEDMTVNMTEDEALKSAKRSGRKALRNALGTTLGELMFSSDFDLMTQQLFVLDDTKNRIGHQIRSRIQNELLKKSPMWEKISEMRMDKSVDRKETAKLIKEALEGMGYDEDKLTELRDEALVYTPIYQLMEVCKDETQKVLLAEMVKMPLWTGYLQEVRGISVLTGSKLLYMVGDVTRFSQPSKLVKYAGLAVTEGKPDKPKRGEELNYKPELKSLLLGVIADNFIKSGSQYRKVYDERRKYTEQNRPEWGLTPKTEKPGYKAHYNNDARRVMAKRFLIEFWKAGWLAAGKEPPTLPYAVNILGHDLEPDIVSYQSPQYEYIE